MTTMLIAIPSDNPGGLDARVSAHFGHCDLYTLAEIDADGLKSVSTMPNPPHQEGGCLAPVQLLAAKGVKKLLAGGMGRRPLMGFQEAGIDVLLSRDCGTVGEAVNAFQNNKLAMFSLDSVCGGSGGCH
jgi:predicted Fe-Mo cluster-binding NifX family protein